MISLRHLVEAVVFLFRQYLVVFVFLVTALVIGRVAVRLLVLHSKLEKGLIATALGSAAIGHALYLLGLAGLLEPLPVVFFVVFAHVLCRSEWRELWAQRRRIVTIPPPSRARKALWLALVLAPLIVLPLYPPTSFDSTLYHLPYAKEFARSGDLSFLESLRFPVFPQLMEVLFAGVMLFAGDVAAQSLQALFTVLTAGLVFVWGKESFGRSAGWLGAATYLGNPIVTYLAGTAYVDPGVALFVTSALLVVWRLRESGNRVWIIVAAVFSSSAAAAKYLGLFFVAALALLVVLIPSQRERWRNVLLYAAACSALLLPWYGRIFLHTGNPFFPYFSGFFGWSPWTHVGPAMRPVSPLSVLTVVWDLSFRRETFSWQPPISPLYLLVLPLALLAAIRDRRVRPLVLVILAYAVFALSLPTDPRYFVPILPLASVAAGAGLARLPLARLRLTAVAVVVLLAPGWIYAVWQVRRMGGIPLTIEQRDEFLSRRLPAYAALRYLNRTRGGNYTLYAFHAENMIYFAEGRFLGDWFGPASFEKVWAGSASPLSLHSKLRALGVDHLLLVRGAPPDLSLHDSRFTNLFRNVYSDAHTRVFTLEKSERPEVLDRAPPGRRSAR